MRRQIVARQLLEALGGGVRTSAPSYRYTGMAKMLLDNLGVDPLLEYERSTGGICDCNHRQRQAMI